MLKYNKYLQHFSYHFLLIIIKIFLYTSDFFLFLLHETLVCHQHITSACSYSQYVDGWNHYIRALTSTRY